MKAVLFVDDEPAVLEALRYALFRERRRWSIVFVTSGASALAELAKTSYDVIVSDLNMPDMDGLELLARVRAEHPSTVRVILSGNIERSVDGAVAHEVLAKPCPMPALRSCLEHWLG